MRTLVGIGLSVGVMAAALTFDADASARTVVFVHGFNPTSVSQASYWNIGVSGDGVAGFDGNNAEGHYNYDYNTTLSWADLSGNDRPVCALTSAMSSAPGTDLVALSHSAGGPVVLEMLSAAQNGWATSCAISPASARSWTTYVVPVAGPFRGTEMADSIYGHGGGGFFQQNCQTLAAGVAGLVINSNNAMTYALQTSYTNNNFASLTSYGTYGSIYQNAGTGTGGDDGTALGFAAWCANIEGTNDGVVSCNSALGKTRGSSCGTGGLPGGHVNWYDTVSHSSNRRNDYKSYATNVWNNAPY